MLVAKKKSSLDADVLTMKTSSGISNHVASKNSIKKLPKSSNLKIFSQPMQQLQKPTPKKSQNLISSL
jgi:hypothetical protein